MSASNTDLPRIRAAIVTATEVMGVIPVPFSINTRMNATTCRATKKKIVGGSNAMSSSLIFANTLFTAFPDGMLQLWPANVADPRYVRSGRNRFGARTRTCGHSKSGQPCEAARGEDHSDQLLGPLAAA